MANKLPDSRIKDLIRECQAEASKAIELGNPPFGCVITDLNGAIVARAFNTQESESDPTGHAEINALRALGKKAGSRYLEDYIVFANASSCSMCMSACIKARITQFHYSAPPESSMNPWITMEDIAKKSNGSIEIHGPLLGEQCAAQITQGRNKNR